MCNYQGFLCLAVLSALPVHAQIDGRITGRVVDASGAAMPSARVNLFLPGGQKPLLATTTSTDGLYHFIGVRAGEFDLTVEAAGFVKVTLRNITSILRARPPFPKSGSN